MHWLNHRDSASPLHRTTQPRVLRPSVRSATPFPLASSRVQSKLIITSQAQRADSAIAQARAKRRPGFRACPLASAESAIQSASCPTLYGCTPSSPLCLTFVHLCLTLFNLKKMLPEEKWLRSSVPSPAKNIFPAKNAPEASPPLIINNPLPGSWWVLVSPKWVLVGLWWVLPGPNPLQVSPTHQNSSSSRAKSNYPGSTHFNPI